MAISTDTPTEDAATTTEALTEDQGNSAVPRESAAGQRTAAEDTANLGDADRQEEVPALLGGNATTEGDEQKPEDRAAASTDDLYTESDIKNTLSTPKDQEESAAELSAILESLKDSLAHTHYISSKIDAVAVDTDCLIKQVNTLSTRYDVLTAEIESNTSETSTTHSLSKAFLIISSSAIAFLVISQIYMFSSLVKTQRMQAVAGSAVLGNISGLNKKMASYNNNISRVLENPSQQALALTKPELAQKSAHESPGNTELGSASATPVLEKLNKLRNGLPEKKLIRKETGDWFIFNNKKNEECIADVEIVDALNQAFKKIGKTLSSPIPLPAHNAVCLLKPDGKGGTEIVMTKSFVP